MAKRRRRGRGLRAAERELGIVSDIGAEGAGRELARGAVSGLLGMPGDLQQIVGMIVNQLPIQAQVVARELLGGASLPTSDEFAESMGANLSRPTTQIGMIGAPDPSDFRRVPQGLLGMTLFHGTPHKFSKFELDKIGSGEGAQAFGHGLYFAENPGVAKTYQSTLSGGRQEVLNAIDVITGDVPLESMKFPQNTQKAIDTIKADPDLLTEIQSLAPSKITGTRPFKTAGGKTRGELVESLQDKLDLGHLYEVEIPDEVTAKMLDWDKPLSEQPESVRRALEKLSLTDGEDFFTVEGAKPLSDVTGQDAYDLLTTAFREGHIGTSIQASKATEGASAVLNEAGIPGIRYFDGGSRKAGDGTRNIVLFDPDLITEVKRDGEKVFSK